MHILSDKKNRLYFGGIVMYMILSVFVYWDRELDIMNTTVFAFNYKYGFMSRGVLGEFLQFLDNHTAVDVISYNTVYQISMIATAIYFAMLIWFIYAVLSKADKDMVTNVKWMLLVLIFISVPMFLGKDNFGRLDVYLMIITLFCLILLIYEKCEFLIIIAVAFATLIHEGFVFMNLNIILVFLLYKCIVKSDKKVRIKYITYLALTFLIPSIIFLYCEFFSHTFDEAVYNEVYNTASVLSRGEPHKQVLVHEILGLDVADMEVIHHRWNMEDTPIFLMLFSLYIVCMIMACRLFFKSAKGNVDKLISLAVIIAPLTLVPEIILKVDYGRYAFSIIFYYLAAFICLIAFKDAKASYTIDCCKDVILRHKLIAILALFYLFLFIPFRGYRICDVVTELTRLIFGN